MKAACSHPQTVTYSVGGTEEYITKEYASGQMEDFINGALNDFLKDYQDAVLERALGE